MAINDIVRHNGADHYKLISDFIKALKADIQASGFVLGSYSPVNPPKGPQDTYDFALGYSMPGSNVEVGQILVWSTRMPSDRIRITLTGLDFPTRQ